MSKMSSSTFATVDKYSVIVQILGGTAGVYQLRTNEDATMARRY